MRHKPEGQCQCGHLAEAHEHYRKGTDCGVCGTASCGAFTAATSPPEAILIESVESPDPERLVRQSRVVETNDHSSETSTAIAT